MNLGTIFVMGALSAGLLYLVPRMVATAIARGWYSTRSKYPNVNTNSHSINLQLTIPALHILRSFFKREGALGTAERVEVEMGARRAMLAQVGAEIFQDDNIVTELGNGDTVYKFNYSQFCKVAEEYDPKYHFVGKSEQKPNS